VGTTVPRARRSDTSNAIWLATLRASVTSTEVTKVIRVSCVGPTHRGRCDRRAERHETNLLRCFGPERVGAGRPTPCCSRFGRGTMPAGGGDIPGSPRCTLCRYDELSENRASRGSYHRTASNRQACGCHGRKRATRMEAAVKDVSSRCQPAAERRSRHVAVREKCGNGETPARVQGWYVQVINGVRRCATRHMTWRWPCGRLLDDTLPGRRPLHQVRRDGRPVRAVGPPGLGE
jgi:hypothetical protein